MSHGLIEARLAALPANASVRFATLMEWILQQFDAAIDAVGVDNVVLAAHTLYDKYIAPLDVPWVPNEREPELIDLPAKYLLARVIHGLHDRVHNAPSAPAPAPAPSVTPSGSM